MALSANPHSSLDVVKTVSDAATNKLLALISLLRDFNCLEISTQQFKSGTLEANQFLVK
jgi:hypothetical protein